MERHLRSRQHYIDLYDKLTVARCRRWLAVSRNTEPPEDATEEEQKKAATEAGVRRLVDELSIHFMSGEEYIQKEPTIRKWMERDAEYDRIYEHAVAPEDVTCLTCGRLMFVSSRHLDIGVLRKDKTSVAFFYDCPLEHLPRRVFLEDGEEWRKKEKSCPKCSGNLTDTRTRESKERVVITSTCGKCDYTEDTEIDLSPTPEEEDPDFAKDRERFCLSEEAGQKYVEEKARLEQLSKLMEEIKEREKNKEVYEEVAKLKKLKITELEELLVPVLEKSQYVKLQFKAPEVSKDVFVPFVAYDAKPEREEPASTFELNKIIKKALEGTNWRLTVDGTSYRLGMLEGRLHGYEREEDLLKLVSKRDTRV